MVASQRGVLWIEPSRGLATFLYSLLALAGLGVTAAVLLHRRGSWPQTWPQPPSPVTDLQLLLIAAFTLLLASAAVVNGRRWYTARVVVATSRRLGAELPPGQVQPQGPYARPVPELEIEECQPPRFRKRVTGLRRVTATANVLGRPPLHIVYLRVFENQPRSRTFVRGAWREFGHVYLLRSAASVSPAALRRARRDGRLDRLFVDDRERLRRRLDRPPPAPHGPGLRTEGTIAGSSVVVFDRYGGYPVTSVTCTARFWQDALDELLARADLVVLDLSGYLTRNKGTQYELQRLVDTFPASRVLLLTDPRSNRRFLRGQIREAWDHMAAGSPNAGPGQRTVRLAVTDHYVEVQTQPATGHAPAPTRTELRASRAQTRWLLARAPQCVHGVVPPGPSPHVEGTPPGPSPHVEETHRDERRPRLLLAAGIAVAVVTAGVLGWTLAGRGFPGGGGGVGASVVEDYKVHSGPANEAPTVGVVRTGEEVVLACVTPAGWARLQDPSPGGYVHRSGLQLEAEPPPC
jgi:hypothetical protein